MKTRSFFLCESGAGAPGPLVLTENKSMTGRREKDSGFCLRRAVCRSARVLALTVSQPFTTKTRRAQRGFCFCIGESVGESQTRLEVGWLVFD